MVFGEIDIGKYLYIMLNIDNSRPESDKSDSLIVTTVNIKKNKQDLNLISKTSNTHAGFPPTTYIKCLHYIIH